MLIPTVAGCCSALGSTCKYISMILGGGARVWFPKCVDNIKNFIVVLTGNYQVTVSLNLVEFLCELNV